MTDAITFGQTTNNFDNDGSGDVVTAIGGDITLVDSGDLTLGTITAGGFVSATADVDNNDVSTLRITGPISSGTSTTLAGGTDNNDTIDIDADITAGSDIVIQNALDVRIDASTARTLTANGGGIAVTTGIGGITLDGGSDTVTFDSNDNASTVDLAAIVDDGIGGTAADLVITSDGSVTSAGIDLGDTNDGTLSITIDSAGGTTQSLTINGELTNVDSLTLSGNGTDETFTINQDLTTTGGALTVQNASLIDVNSQLSAASDLDLINATTVSIASSAAPTLSAGGSIDVSTGVTGITLDGGGDVSMAGLAGITLAPVTSAGTSLVLDSGTTGTISAATISGIGTLDIAGSAGANFQSVSADTIDVSDTEDGQNVVFNGDVSATTLTTTANGYHLVFNGANNSFANAVTFNNIGSLTFGDGAGDTTTFSNGVTATSVSDISLRGTVQSLGTSGILLGDADTSIAVAANSTIGGAGTGAIDLGDVVLSDGVTLNVGTGIANTITMDSVAGTTGGTASTIALNTTGIINVAGSVGTDIGALTVTNSG
ncbi:MAG: hypothetical protein WD558_02580, partial [Pseudomonadales bacterium]